MLRRLTGMLTTFTLCLAPQLALAKKKGPGKSESEKALNQAKHDWQSLRGDAKHNKYRSNWLKVAARFEEVAKRYPKSEEAAKSLFDAGELYEDLSRISWLTDDVDEAAQLYARVSKDYPRSSLADDAQLALARLYLSRKNDSDHARVELKRLLKQHPDGDMAEQAKQLLATLPAEEKPERKKRDSKKEKAEKAEAKVERVEKTEKADKAVVAEAESKPHPLPLAGEGRGEGAGPKRPHPSPVPQAGEGEDSPEPKSEPAEAKAEAKPEPKAEKAEAKAEKVEKKEKRHRKKNAPAPEAPAKQEPTELAERKPTPIVPPETIDGRVAEPALAQAVAEPEPHGGASQTEAKLYEANEIIRAEPARPARPEHLDKDKLTALRSAVRTSAELPLSAQMGLKVRRVVVDAGHGGHDTGAIGPSGLREKDASLAVARKLADKLRSQGLEVLLTRSDDKFVPLEGRAAFANENRADLFISVHCNAAENTKLHGVETYSLNTSSNQYAMRLAARENAASERSISDLQYLLADLTTKANTADSRRLARTVQTSITGGMRTKYDAVRDLGTKEALFYVLMGTRMPAILVEGAFISNPAEEKRLADPEFQDQLATSIAAGVSRFVEDRQSLSGMPVATLP